MSTTNTTTEPPSSLGSRADEAQTTTPSDSVDGELITDAAARLLNDATATQTTSDTSTSPTPTATVDTEVAVATDAATTSPGATFYTSYSTFQRTGTDAPIATFAETVGAGDQSATRTGVLNAEGQWDITQNTDPTGEWDEVVKGIQRRWGDIVSSRRAFNATDTAAGSIVADTIGEGSGSPFDRLFESFLAPSFAPSLAPFGLGSIFNSDPFFSPFGQRSLIPSTMGPRFGFPGLFGFPMMVRRPLDEDTQVPSPPASLEASTAAPMITVD